MEDGDVVPTEFVGKKPLSISYRPIQWVMTAYCALIALLHFGPGQHVNLPNASVALFGTSVAVALIVTVLHSPPVFFRLPRTAKLAAYVGLLAAAILFSRTSEQLQSVYVRTPEGMREAAASAVQAKREAAERVETEKREAEAKAVLTWNAAQETIRQEGARVAQAQTEGAKEAFEKLNRCFSLFGHQISAFNASVQDSLDNPHSFEHVRTDIIATDPEGYNVEMIFRGQNRFSAIITNSVRAKINPESCEVESTGKFFSD